ncbi:PilW family protein [Pseudoalteromonas sp. B193]
MVNTEALSNPLNDCFEGLNNGSFPDLATASNFRTIYAKVADASKELNCVTSPVKGTDIIQLKFLQGDQLTEGETQTSENYFIAEQERAQFKRGEITGSSVNASIWPYSHHVYYISEQTYKVNNKNLTVPALMRKRLVGGNITTETIMEGVENMRFVFGLDTNSDNRVDTYRSIKSMEHTDWGKSKGYFNSTGIFINAHWSQTLGLKLKPNLHIR